MGGRIRFALERLDSPSHRSHVAQLFSLGDITLLRFMNLTIKRVLIAGAVATVLMFVLGTPEIITQLIIFIPSFVITFSVLSFLSKKRIQKL